VTKQGPDPNAQARQSASSIAASGSMGLRPSGRGPTLLLLALSLILPPFLCIVALLMPGPLGAPMTVIVARGTGIHDIAIMLDKNGVVYSELVFRLAAKLVARDSLKAGEYEFTPGQSAADIALMMNQGRSVLHLFRIAEGLTSGDIIQLLKADPALAGETGPMPTEGSLLPESYRYSYGDSRSGMIARMQKAMQDTLTELWGKRDPAVPAKTPMEAITMASIIEKETGKAVERPRIAGVFYNRLRQNMRLQSDPTVIYAITQARGQMDHTLAHGDLAFSSPINTYFNDGLPPQPICNPGRASIEAALHPESNDYLYFVADGTGGHVFAHDLTTHNQNVTHWNETKQKP
jgi:UPF0755 protein